LYELRQQAVYVHVNVFRVFETDLVQGHHGSLRRKR